MQERPGGESASAMALIKCAPDEHGCIDLGSVMRIMSQIDQEQAWALAYQLAALMQRLWPAGNNCATIESLAQIYINQEGWVHEKSLLVVGQAGRSATNRRRSRSEESSPTEEPEDDDDDESVHKNSHQSALAQPTTGVVATSQQRQSNAEQTATTAAAAKIQLATSKLPPTPPITPELHEQLQRRQRATSEQELVSSLGIALFRALDYGIPDDEERKLSRPMEFLIVESQKGLTLAEVLEICVERLPEQANKGNKLTAEQHYREVCKTLIADTIELALLLDKIYTATMVMNGAGPAAHGLQTATPLPPLPTSTENNNNQNNNNNNTSDMMSHHQATNYMHLSASRREHTAHYLHHHLLHTIDQDELSELGLPLASLRALKINEWARLWMQVIRELRQKRLFQQQQQRQNQYELDSSDHSSSTPNEVLQAV